MYYSKNLIELREASNLTRKELAEKLNIERSLYGKYESEYLIMPIKQLLKCCKYFNVSLNYILSLSKNTECEIKDEDINVNIIAKRIKEIRKDFKVTQVNLAEFLNIGKGTIAEYEKGNYIISTHTLYAICLKYKVSADWLVGKTDYPKYLQEK